MTEELFTKILAWVFISGLSLMCLLLFISMFFIPKATSHVCSKCSASDYTTEDCGYMGSDTAFICNRCGQIDY